MATRQISSLMLAAEVLQRMAALAGAVTAGQVFRRNVAGTDWEYATIVTPWVTYTPTFVGLGTPTGVLVRSRRVGGDLEIIGRVTAGTSTGDNVTMSLGFDGVNGGLTVDSALTALQHVGSGSVSYTGAFVATTLALGGDNVIKFGLSSSVRSGLTPVLGTSLAASGDTVSFRCSVPIEGWS